MSGKRNIFEEVGSDEKAEAAVVGAISQSDGEDRNLTQIWRW